MDYYLDPKIRFWEKLSIWRHTVILIFAPFRLKFILFLVLSSLLCNGLYRACLVGNFLQQTNRLRKLCRYNFFIKNFSQRTADRSAIVGNWLVLILSWCHTQILPTGVYLCLRSVGFFYYLKKCSWVFMANSYFIRSARCVVVVRRDYIWSL